MIKPFLISTFLATGAWADAYTVKHLVRPGQILNEHILAPLSDSTAPQMQLSDIVDQEAAQAIYPGQPITAQSLKPPALVDRNALIDIIFVDGSLKISVAGRALGRAALGERVQAMNLESRKIVIGVVQNTAQIVVSR